MSIWGELKWTSDMYVPACRLLSFQAAVMPSFVVFFFSVLKMNMFLKKAIIFIFGNFENFPDEEFV